MFGYSLIKTDELRGLKIIAAKYQMARKNSWWPHQAFVTRLLRRVTSGEHDILLTAKTDIMRCRIDLFS